MKRYFLKAPNRAKGYIVNYESELNQEQYAVVMAGNGPILVIAGAGSGKTRTVTYRVARLVESEIDPTRILLVTFTNKAAREMLHRAELLIKMDVRRLWGGTFHHIANLILRRHASAIGYKSNFSILDREDTKELLNNCIAEIGINTKAMRFPQGDVLSEISGLSINTEEGVESLILRRFPYFVHLIDDIERVFLRYSEKKSKLNLMDFDDLLFNLRRLLTEDEEIKEIYANKFQHILIDEYQDTNKLQADIVDILASRHRNIMVVGDDSQSIYSFRGANFSNIIEFPKRYSDAQIYKLTINYRSAPEILDLANYSIRYNRRQFPKELTAVKAERSKPVLIAFNDLMEQASFVAQRILELRDEGIPLNEIAVLYRSHYHSMELQMELTRRGIPYEVRSGIRFFEQAHIKDITSYLKVIVNPFDELAWKRILKLIPKIGNVTTSKIWDFISKTDDPLSSIFSDDTIKLIPKGALDSFNGFLNSLISIGSAKTPSLMLEYALENGYEEYLFSRYPNAESRIEDITQLSVYASRFDSPKSFLSELALLNSVIAEDIITDEGEDESVKLSSVHQAKGLEWKTIFIICLSEGRFPSARSLRDDDGLEEERRLFYVAVTRAKDELYLCYPLMAQGGYSEAVVLKPSRFIQELPEESYEKWIIADDMDYPMGNRLRYLIDEDDTD